MKIEAFHEQWKLRSPFSISRGSKSFVEVVKVIITRNDLAGTGECVPYARYEQDIANTLQTISSIEQTCKGKLDRNILNRNFCSSSARNALDCALWQLESIESGLPVWQLASLPQPKSVPGVYSLSLEPPQGLAKSAHARKNFPLLKIKLGNNQVVESVEAVREVCPDHRIIVDANEAWDFRSLNSYLPRLADLGVEMIEQPLHASADHHLEHFDSEIPLCADESFHTTTDLDRLFGRYDIFNVKLDKSGGLTEAIKTVEKVRSAGKSVMIGSMMSTSYSLAPAMLLAQDAAYVDLDSSVWLEEDHPGGIEFIDGVLHPAKSSLWG
ncbi:MAG: dipeptide epimerase [Acidiferrobacterales bacterium]|nr:dipeptide epimerase [Acidiferrobacterales bacterium]